MGISLIFFSNWGRVAQSEEIRCGGPASYLMGRCQYHVTSWDRSHGLPALSHVWQHLKLSDVSLGTLQWYSLVVDKDIKKPNKQNKL